VWYLLNKLFGLRPSEIAGVERLDKNNSSVHQLIIRVSDQLKAGESQSPEISVSQKQKLDCSTHDAATWLFIKWTRDTEIIFTPGIEY